MGLEALSYLRSGNATPSGWQAKQTALLHDTEQAAWFESRGAAAV
jgi:hypothetical protein